MPWRQRCSYRCLGGRGVVIGALEAEVPNLSITSLVYGQIMKINKHNEFIVLVEEGGC